MIVPFTRIMNPTSANLVQLDQARAQALRLYAAMNPNNTGQARSIFNIPATAQAVSYVASAYIGNPPTEYSLLIDTGSSNTWVGAGQPYVESSTTVDTGDLVLVGYGSGAFFGREVIDQMTLGPSLTIVNQSIGAALLSKGFDGVDGILGIGPQDLTCGTLVTDMTACIPTVLDNAWTQGLISNYEVGISFVPATSPSDTSTSGEISFGGVDQSKFGGNLQYVPITSTSPASNYVGIDQSVYYGDQLILDTTSGIVDTGTTLLLLASDAFGMYQNATGATMDQTTGLLQITPAQYEQLQSMYFDIGGNRYELTPNAQIWPRVLNEALGGEAGAIYLIVSDSGSPSGQGLDFINGMKFLERFYAVYDVGNERVGFAPTAHTHANSN
ncbi:family A1 protease [Sparassis latifolia]